MEIELSGVVRGETVKVHWCDGEMDGSPVVLDRLEPLLDDGRCDTVDLTSVIRCVEQVTGQRMKLRVLDERSPQSGHVFSAA
jgi:hypothetical protein